MIYFVRNAYKSLMRLLMHKPLFSITIGNGSFMVGDISNSQQEWRCADAIIAQGAYSTGRWPYIIHDIERLSLMVKRSISKNQNSVVKHPSVVMIVPMFSSIPVPYKNLVMLQGALLAYKASVRLVAFTTEPSRASHEDDLLRSPNLLENFMLCAGNALGKWMIGLCIVFAVLGYGGYYGLDIMRNMLAQQYRVIDEVKSLINRLPLLVHEKSASSPAPRKNISTRNILNMLQVLSHAIPGAVYLENVECVLAQSSDSVACAWQVTGYGQKGKDGILFARQLVGQAHLQGLAKFEVSSNAIKYIEGAVDKPYSIYLRGFF